LYSAIWRKKRVPSTSVFVSFVLLVLIFYLKRETIFIIIVLNFRVIFVRRILFVVNDHFSNETNSTKIATSLDFIYYSVRRSHI